MDSFIILAFLLKIWYDVTMLWIERVKILKLLLYSIVIFFATMMGTATGAGSGTVIKSVLDFLSTDSVIVVGVYSSTAVFAMCLTSVYRQIKVGIHLDKKMAMTLSVGSLLGGYSGEQIFKWLTSQLSNNTIKLYQSLLLCCVLFAITIYTIKKEQLPKFQVRHLGVVGSIAFSVGFIALFLGIGGGALNMALLMIFLNLSAKEAAIYSLVMILFSQLPKIVLIVLNMAYYQLNWVVYGVVIIASFIGGLVGAKINRQLDKQVIEKMYVALLISLIVICVINSVGIIS